MVPNAHLSSLVLMGTTDNVQTLTERSVQPTKIIAESEHLLGHRSVRISPHGCVVIPIAID